MIAIYPQIFLWRGYEYKYVLHIMNGYKTSYVSLSYSIMGKLNWFKQYLFMNFTQVNIFTVSVGIEQQEKSYVKLSPK